MKKIISVLLAILTILSTFSVFAFAQEPEKTLITGLDITVDTNVAGKNPRVGDYITVNSPNAQLDADGEIGVDLANLPPFTLVQIDEYEYEKSYVVSFPVEAKEGYVLPADPALLVDGIKVNGTEVLHMKATEGETFYDFRKAGYYDKESEAIVVSFSFTVTGPKPFAHDLKIFLNKVYDFFLSLLEPFFDVINRIF